MLEYSTFEQGKHLFQPLSEVCVGNSPDSSGVVENKKIESNSKKFPCGWKLKVFFPYKKCSSVFR